MTFVEASSLSTQPETLSSFPPRAHKRRKPLGSSQLQPTSTSRPPVIVEINKGARAGSGGRGATEGRQGEVLEALADQERVELARQG
jgi:hypothetical protein